MENGPFIDDLPIIKRFFLIAMLNYQRVNKMSAIQTVGGDLGHGKSERKQRLLSGVFSMP